ncbi:kelch-like protein 24 isoform X2 [Sceloporus undulatus]|uniref:kelch-like protein 24 isoform X2 n=1 Tax=Sceloporus undulatus TaxID=8520 RepID=UPI001C4CA119|nr:kelch-like protein 24 isoform X2 [Sceloporus undulatus]
MSSSSSHKKGEPAMLKPRPLGLRKGLAEMYQEELLCDIVLVADGQRFPCHRALLAAVSPYFQDIFINSWKESDGKEILVQDVAPSIIQSILKYIYTGDIELTPELTPFFFAGASKLQVVPLQNLCCRFLVTNLSVQNCFEMYSMAQVHKSRTLLHETVQLLIRNFDQVFEAGGFLHLEFSTLLALISSSDLAVASEYQVYQAVRRWVQGHPSLRGPLLGQLVQHVRFPLLSLEEQYELQKDLEQQKDLHLTWKILNGEERLRQSKGLRRGMYKPHIAFIDTQLCEYQELETEEAYMGCYEPLAEQWEKLPGLPSVTHASCVSAGDKIYVSGGVYQSAYSTSVHEFSAFTGQWLQLPSMSLARAAHGFLFHNQKLYVLGGWRKFQSFLNLAESLDLATGRWDTIAKLPFSLSHPATSVFRDKLYLLGGATGLSSHWLFHRGILIYDIGSSAWTQVPLSIGFFAAGAVAGDHGIYVIGGYSEKKANLGGKLAADNRHSSRRCFFVNEAGHMSRSFAIPRLPRGIANAGVVYCGKRIYVLGGEDLEQRYKVIYHWEPGEPRWHRGAKEIPVPREGISRFACGLLLQPKPHILQLFQVTSLVPTAAICK